MRVVVIGAGVVGVTTAWYLAAAGHQVTVVDRQPEPGRETSYANGGQISVCHAEPWANPAAPLNALKWLGKEDAPLLWRLRADAAQWLWGMRFLVECLPGRTRANIIALIGLGLYSRGALQALRRELGLDYDQLEKGILHIYTDRRDFDQAVPRAAMMTALGCDRRVVDADGCVTIEPALADARQMLVGGTYTVADESGDANAFTRILAAYCAERGVSFRMGGTVQRLLGGMDRIEGIRLADGERIQADAFVLAAGSYTPLLLRTVGLGARMPIYPAKGYSITLALSDLTEAPSVSLTDDGHKLVISRLGNRLRVAGTAEFCGYDLTLNRARLAAIERRARQIFPRLGADALAECWAGLRPATPGNVPMIGATACPNLYINSGHGTLGWTLACGSGRLLADLVSGRPADIDPTPYRAA
ncbi:MAG: D-amino acid dehydrogenase [Rhodocyclaceae bacterium]|nr:D-amino acid dehydrogenase [Rhodocyclaceae bacterium]